MGNENTRENAQDEKSEFNEMDDTYNECIIDPNNDRRTIVSDSQNKNDGIMHCIGSIESQYIPDKNVQQVERVHGTGTAIRIDNQNNVYVLSAAHNIFGVEKQCVKCKTKTLKSGCPNKNCKFAEKTERTGHLINPTHIYFDRREHIVKEKLGESVRRYAIEDRKVPDQYRKNPSAKSGYDICMIVFECDDKNGIDLYKNNCSKIHLINDESLGGEKCQLYIYGYPGETREKKHKSVYYYLLGMCTSTLDTTNKFTVTSNSMNKLYIVNKGIDTTTGQSGSCVYSYHGRDKSRYLIYGLHTGGSQIKRANYATFFDVEIVEWIANAIDANAAMSNKFIYVIVREQFLKTQKMLNDSNNQNIKLNKIVQKKEKDINRLNKKINEKNNENIKLKEKNTKNRKSIDAQDNENSKLKKTNKQQAKEIEELKKTIKSLRQQMTTDKQQLTVLQQLKKTSNQTILSVVSVTTLFFLCLYWRSGWWQTGAVDNDSTMDIQQYVTKPNVISTVGFFLLRILLHCISLFCSENAVEQYYKKKYTLCIVCVAVLSFAQAANVWCIGCGVHWNLMGLFVLVWQIGSIIYGKTHMIDIVGLGVYACLWLVVFDVIPMVLWSGEEIFIVLKNNWDSHRLIDKILLSICKLWLLIWIYINFNWIAVCFEILHFALACASIHYRILNLDEGVYILIYLFTHGILLLAFEMTQ